MDDATAETVLSLQLEDLDGILAGEEATEEIGEVTDQRLAVTLYRDQLRERVSSLADRRMSLSIGSAVWQDGVLLTTSRAHEFAATRDRIVAQRLAGVPQVQCPLPNALPQTDLSDATIRHVAAYNAAAPIPVGSIFPVISSEHEHQSLGSMSKKRTRHHTANTEDASYDEQRALKRTKNTHHHSTSDTLEHAVARDIPKSPPRKRKRSTSNDVQTHEQAAASTISGTAYSEQFSDIDGVRSIQADLRAQEEESAGINPNKRIRAAALGQPAAEPESACIVCGDPGLYADLVKAPCEHSYCTDCITGFFEAGVKDGSVFPPKCCGQEIPLSIAAAYLSEDLVTKVNERAQANTSPNATYCAQPYCSVYIPPSNVELGHGTCPKCSTRTCCRCRKEARFGDCVKDEDLERVRELAKKEGWQACYDCNALIELNFGCNHMTCRCNAEFCYICGTKWRNCDCPRWHEGRLLARAEHLVDRPREDNDHRPLDVRDRAVRIREATNYLLAGPECDHNNWEYIEGVGTCEICDYTGLVYIYLCRGCGTTSCNWCNTMAREEQEPRARVNRRQGRNGFRGRGSGRRASARV